MPDTFLGDWVGGGWHFRGRGSGEFGGIVCSGAIGNWQAVVRYYDGGAAVLVFAFLTMYNGVGDFSGVLGIGIMVAAILLVYLA